MPRRERPPTLRNVAELAGTSTAVVSYVVNDGPRPVAAGTRKRVNDAIAELGYRPNRAARTLATARSHAIGLVIPDMTNSFFADLGRAVEQHARAQGLITLIGNSAYDPEREAGYVEAFEDYGADAIMVICGDLAVPWTASVSTPLIFVHRRPTGSTGGVVRFDDAAGTRLAVEYLHGLGHRTVHCIAGFETVGPIEERVTAWRDLQSEAGRSGELIRVPYQRTQAAEALVEWLKTVKLPAAVVATTDEQALGLLSACDRSGLHVPRDVAVVGYDDTSAAETSVPALTTVRVPIDELAAIAIDLVLSGAHDTELTCTGSELIIRESA